jgi:hypothetical protein
MDRTTIVSTEININQNTISIFCNSYLPDNSGKVTLKYLKKSFPDLFYPQDWYDNEYFMNESFESGWYTVSKNILDSSKGELPPKNGLYPASLLTYIFIVFYIKYNEILWPNDYIWCDTFDSSGDQIYVGRYYDSLGFSKNGFSIHRHLSIKNNYGWF